MHFSCARSTVCEPLETGAPVDKGIEGIMEPSTTVARAAAGAGRAAPAPAGSVAGAPDPGAFDRAKLEQASGTSALADWLLRHPHRVISIVRWLTPVLRWPHCLRWLRWLRHIPLLSWITWVVVLRYDEVREVLSKNLDFPVAWGGRMIEVTQGRNFVLGMPEDGAYRLSYQQLAQAFPREDVAEYVARPAAAIAAEILAGKTGENPPVFDAIEDLIAAVPTHLVERYYGIQIPDKAMFANWTLAISSYLFGPSASDSGAALARSAAAELRNAIRGSIAHARNLPKDDPQLGKAMQRLIEMLPRSEDEVIHAQLFGMVMGFIPTNVLAGGNILETLLRNPEFMRRARAAAQADDDDLLWRCLRETLRFRHINPGPWRICPDGYTFGVGGPREIRISPDSKVLAIIQSAMFDPRRIERPQVFDPDRRDEDYMVFGFGQHWCLGAYIAKAQLTQTFKPLLKMKPLQAVDNPQVRTTRFNDLFPLHLDVRFVA